MKILYNILTDDKKRVYPKVTKGYYISITKEMYNF